MQVITSCPKAGRKNHSADNCLHCRNAKAVICAVRVIEKMPTDAYLTGQIYSAICREVGHSALDRPVKRSRENEAALRTLTAAPTDLRQPAQRQRLLRSVSISPRIRSPNRRRRGIRWPSRHRQ